MVSDRLFLQKIVFDVCMFRFMFVSVLKFVDSEEFCRFRTFVQNS